MNPWDLMQTSFHTLQSRYLAPDKLVIDFEISIADGEKQVVDLFEKRIITDDLKLTSTIKLNKRCNFYAPPKLHNEAANVNKTGHKEQKAFLYSFVRCCTEVSIRFNISNEASSTHIQCFFFVFFYIFSK